MCQPRIQPTPKEISLVGKTVIVTGGNSGLGYEAARQFLVLNAARVIIACRSLSRGQAAVSSLRADPEVTENNPGAIVEVYELDLADYQSGLKFAHKVKREVKELDILLNNGGQSVLKYETASSGHERNMQVNCYTHILITLELLPLLRATARMRGTFTRIAFTGSALHASQETLTRKPVKAGDSVLAHWDDEAKFNKLFRYADTKLCLSAYARKLARVAPDEVLVNSLCPGLVKTGRDQNLPSYLRWLVYGVRRSIGRSPQIGARTLVYATTVAGPETNGKFLRNNRIDRGAAFLNKPEGEKFIEKLWKETVSECADIDPLMSSYLEVE